VAEILARLAVDHDLPRRVVSQIDDGDRECARERLLGERGAGRVRRHGDQARAQDCDREDPELILHQALWSGPKMLSSRSRECR